jgi:hypothetical protein
VARIRRQVAVAAIAAGAVLVVVVAALAVNAIWLSARLVPSNQVHDTYFVVPSAWVGLLIFGAGAIGDLAFRGAAARFGRPAPAIWQSHLFFTTVLIIIALVAWALVDMTWQMALFLYAIYSLMLLAHGTALTLGGLLVLQIDKRL